jgi:hypothetical protein
MLTSSDPMVQHLDDPTRVSRRAEPILRAMLRDLRVGYSESASRALEALDDGHLIAIQACSGRLWITLREFRARPARAASGALFQCIEKRSPPRSESDLVGWIVIADDYSGGPLVLVHELSHFFNRFVVWLRSEQSAPVADRCLNDDVDPAVVRRLRAQLLNEIAARHMAWLCDAGIDPPRSAMPDPGALFACAVKIASYPEVYNDPGWMRRLLARGDPQLLRDQVGLWFAGLAGFHFFAHGSTRALEHARWLEAEIETARRGANAPDVAPMGTL